MANVCPMCSDFSAPTIRLLIGHIGRVHSCSPNFAFTCGLQNCQRTLKSYSALKKHFQRKHGGLSSIGSSSSEPNTTSTADVDMDDDANHNLDENSDETMINTDEIQRSFKHKAARSELLLSLYALPISKYYCICLYWFQYIFHHHYIDGS